MPEKYLSFFIVSKFCFGLDYIVQGRFNVKFKKLTYRPCRYRLFLTFIVPVAAIFASTNFNMKKCIALFTLLFVAAFGSKAQSTVDNTDKRTTVEKPSRDFVMIKLTTSGWADVPDSINTKGIGRGFAASVMYDFPIKKSHFSFAAGLGFNVKNVFLDGQNINFKDTGSQVVFFNSSDYKRYKLTTTHLELPLELRFFGNNDNRNRGFKAAIGANVGMSIGAHTKGVSGKGGSKYSDKVNTRRYIQQWDFSPTMRIGYGNFSLYGSYSLTPLFKDGSGPQVVPFNVGICLTGL